jgi:hypothetical protein
MFKLYILTFLTIINVTIQHPLSYKHVIYCDTFIQRYEPLAWGGKYVLTKQQLNFFVNEFNVDNIWTKISHPTKDIYNKILPGFIDNPKQNTEWKDLEYSYIITRKKPDYDVATVFTLSSVTKNNKVCTC